MITVKIEVLLAICLSKVSSISYVQLIELRKRLIKLNPKIVTSISRKDLDWVVSYHGYPDYFLQVKTGGITFIQRKTPVVWELGNGCFPRLFLVNLPPEVVETINRTLDQVLL